MGRAGSPRRRVWNWLPKPYSDAIQFRNGYATRAPEMQVEFLMVKKIQKWGSPHYAIKLGRVLAIKRWKP